MSAPQRFRKRPVEIEAMLFDGTNGRDIVAWVISNGQDAQRNLGGVYIVTLEGIMHASVGDYVIRGVQGEFYPCKPDVFAETYEVVVPTVSVQTYGTDQPRVIPLLGNTG